MHRRNFLQLTGALGVALSQAGLAATTLRMGYFEHFEPLSGHDQKGKISGALVESMDLIGRLCDISFEHYGYPWMRAQKMVQSGELDGFCTVATEERRSYVEFAATPVITDIYGIFHRADDKRVDDVRSVADMRPLRQGTYRGNGYDKENLEFDRLIVENDFESILRRIALGSLDTCVGSYFVGRSKLNKLGLTAKLRFTPASFMPPAEFRFGLRRSFSNVTKTVETVDQAIRLAAKSGALQASIEKYMKISNVPKA